MVVRTEEHTPCADLCVHHASKWLETISTTEKYRQVPKDGQKEECYQGQQGTHGKSGIPAGLDGIGKI